MGSTINICEDIYNITKDKIWVSEMSTDYVKKKSFKETAEREYCLLLSILLCIHSILFTNPGHDVKCTC